jgi:L-aspartate oxidase
VYEHHRLIELEHEDERWVATVMHMRTNERFHVRTRVVVLAAGGMGRVFGHTTNPASAVGDAVLLASQAGCRLRDLHRMQFHPTGLRVHDMHGAAAPLITEALRGAGALIVNERGERFLHEVDERGELATRDVVTRALLDHLERSPDAAVFLDCRHLDRAVLQTTFPSFMQACAAHGMDPLRDLIPIEPVAHYQCGGIVTSLNGETGVPGLYAIGECASTGMHGATRLASNSLLEAVVTGLRCAQHIVDQEHIEPFRREMDSLSERLAHVVTHEPRATELRQLIDRVEQLRSQHHLLRVHDRQWYDDRSVLHASSLILRSLLTQADGTEPGRSADTSVRMSSRVP